MNSPFMYSPQPFILASDKTIPGRPGDITLIMPNVVSADCCTRCRIPCQAFPTTDEDHAIISIETIGPII